MSSRVTESPRAASGIDRASIERARRPIDVHIRTTPIVTTAASEFGLACRTGTFKLEQLQHSGSFKARGAFLNVVSRTVPAAGVVATSGGNHGAAVAYAALQTRVRATIFVPTVASPAKIERIRGYGAELRIVGERYTDALAESQGFASETGAVAVHAFDQKETVLGQATFALELAAQPPRSRYHSGSCWRRRSHRGVSAWYGGATRIVVLFGVTPLDPGTYVLAAFVLVAAATLAAYLPARRASRVDPTAALRAD